MSRLRLAAVVVAVVAAVAAGAILLPHSPSGVRGLLVGLGPAAPLIALAGWILLTPAMFPGTVLAAAGGLAFGALEGSLLALGGAIAGGLAAFALARTSKQGHCLAFRVEDEVPRRGRSAVQTADAVPAAGRIGFAAHPFSTSGYMFVPALARRIVLPHGWPALMTARYPPDGESPTSHDRGVEPYLVTDPAANERRLSPRFSLSLRL